MDRFALPLPGAEHHPKLCGPDRQSRPIAQPSPTIRVKVADPAKYLVITGERFRFQVPDRAFDEVPADRRSGSIPALAGLLAKPGSTQPIPEPL